LKVQTVALGYFFRLKGLLTLLGPKYSAVSDMSTTPTQIMRIAGPLSIESM